MRSNKKRPILEVSGLSIQRGDTMILNHLSWTVQPGEHWAILGANGSGKTSLLSALTAYLTPTEGEIDLLGERFGQSNWRELRKKVGIVSSSVRQMMPDGEPALESVVSGKYAMIDYWGRVTRSDRSRALRLLQQIECSYLADRPWLYLSQGERQRVLIGRALMARPKLLILDEPCAGLDPTAREHFLHFLDRLGRRPGAPTLVLVTHHVEEVMPVFSHALLLKEGQVLAAGPKKEVLTGRYLSQTFKASIRLQVRNRRYAMTITSASKKVV